MSTARIGFEMRQIRIPLENILPVRQIKDPNKRIPRYQIILTSIKEVGLVEPLMVHPQRGAQKKYLLLDGHLRYFALKECGESSANCLISTDDESFTYNARVNRLSSIQEHKMIVRAVRNGVRPERIAAVLNIPLRKVRESMNLLNGIHEEAADLLKDKDISQKAICLLRQVIGVRQIEIAELMICTNNFTTPYAEALILGTPKDQLTNPAEPKKKDGMSPEEIARMGHEMESLERDLRGVEDTYGENMLNLTLARGYIKKLLDNAKIVRFLNSNYSDILTEFEATASAESL